MTKLFGIIGILFLGFAFVDFFLGELFNIDLTGVSWSPIVAGAIGSLFGYVAIQAESENQKDKNKSE